MPRWACGIAGCEAAFDGVEDAIVHQTAAHDRHECRVCGAVVPDGYFAIRHAFEEHTRAEFVRAYDADSDDVRERERVKAEIEEVADIERVAERIDGSV
ncbi:hypothetical protein BRC97_08140 [Halobacteriales archaeon QS_6_71_20]|nr:MAG: hypothetical protein BRC97_08140 [Halobacteriales archaeon QS_6_71_20]